MKSFQGKSKRINATLDRLLNNRNTILGVVATKFTFFILFSMRNEGEIEREKKR